MAGAGSTTEGKVNGIDIYGWTTPVTIEKMTNIPTHNLGGSGEDSSYITFRAGGTKVYIDRDITISETLKRMIIADMDLIMILIREICI